MKQYKRSERFNKLLMEEVSTIIQRELKDPRIGFVTVTGVVTTSDLSHATVWLSVYGGEKQRQATLKALEGAAGLLQSKVNKDLRLRRTPQLLFQYDPSVEDGVRMSKLIDELDPGPAEPDEPDAHEEADDADDN